MKKNAMILLVLLIAQFSFAQEVLLPAVQDSDLIVHHQNYTLSYSEAHEQAEWVAYELTKEEILGQYDRADNFRSDTSVSTGSASLNDYRGSGYDRGHLAPAADMKFSADAMSESFYLSNMSPQDPSFNRGIWKKLEAMVRQWAYDNDSIYIVTGPVLNKDSYKTIGSNHVSIPEYYYKIILDFTEPEIKAIGFLLPNEKGVSPVASYAVSVDNVEEITGIDFFSALPDEQEDSLESTFDPSLWNFHQFSQSEYSNQATATDQKADIPDQEGTVQYWINSSSNTRHNSGCRYYGNTKNGYYTDEKIGKPCRTCGG